MMIKYWVRCVRGWGGGGGVWGVFKVVGGGGVIVRGQAEMLMEGVVVFVKKSIVVATRKFIKCSTAGHSERSGCLISGHQLSCMSAERSAIVVSLGVQLLIRGDDSLGQYSAAGDRVCPLSLASPSTSIDYYYYTIPVLITVLVLITTDHQCEEVIWQFMVLHKHRDLSLTLSSVRWYFRSDICVVLVIFSQLHRVVHRLNISWLMMYITCLYLQKKYVSLFVCSFDTLNNLFE